MRWTSMVLLLPLVGLAQADPRLERWNAYYTVHIRSKWAGVEESESRVITVRGVAKSDCAPAARWLMGIIATDDAGDVKRAAVRVLGKFKSPDALREMVAFWERGYKNNVEAKTLALEVFSASKSASAKRPIELGLTKAKDARVIAAACRAAGVGRRIEFTKQLITLLRSKHRAVRGAAAMALAELRVTRAMPAVFLMFCADKSKRVRYDAWVALKKLSLQKHACLPDAWETWWEEQASEFAGTGDSEEGTEEERNPWGAKFPRTARDWEMTSFYFGIPVLGDRIVFVIDCSQRMNNAWRVDHAAQRKLPADKRIPGFFGVKTRWDLQRNHTFRCLKSLADKTEVAFSFFRHELEIFPETGKYLKLNKRARRSIADDFEQVKRTGSTAMYEGLAAGWGFLKDGNPDANFKRGCDTIVFCTTGQPSEGEFKNRKDALRDEVWRISNARHIRVHTVGLHNHAFALLAAMARDSGGLYVHSQEKGDPAEPQDLDFWPAKKKAFEAARKKRKRRG